MELKVKFFDKESWSIHGTINAFISLLLLILFKQKITTQLLIKISILGMMDGALIPKMIFALFISLLIFDGSIGMIQTTIISLFSVYLCHFIPKNNIVAKSIENNIVLLNIFRVIIFLWMTYISYDLTKPLFKKSV